MRPTPETRHSLILRVRDKRDVQAWTEFTEVYQPLVYRLARRMGMQDADAGEATQEVMLHLAEVVGRWQPDRNRGTFRGWLHRVARNVMVRFLQKRSQQPLASGGSGYLALIQHMAAPSQESTMFDDEFRRQVFAWATQQVKGEFEPSTWRAFWDTFVLRQAVVEVADTLHLSKGAVYVARCRVLKRLRQTVQKQIDEDWPDVDTDKPSEEETTI